MRKKKEAQSKAINQTNPSLGYAEGTSPKNNQIKETRMKESNKKLEVESTSINRNTLKQKEIYMKKRIEKAMIKAGRDMADAMSMVNANPTF